MFLVGLVDLVSLDRLDLEGVVHNLVHQERLVDLVFVGSVGSFGYLTPGVDGSLDHLVFLVLEPSFQVVCK